MKSDSHNVSSVTAVADRLPESTRIEYAHLRVRNTTDSLPFYKDLVGLTEVWSHGTTTALSSSNDGSPLLLLTEDRAAALRPVHSAGLFHLALLYPTRRALAEAFMRIHKRGWQFGGFADHGVSEALYMQDAEGNGIELYADRPRTQWPYENGELQMVAEPLDINDLLSELNGLPSQESESGLTIGHIHLQVTNLQSADECYRQALGFDPTQRSFPGALFLAAGGYHHHIGLNVWNSRGGSPSREGTVGLVQFGIRLGSHDAVQSLATRLRKTPYWSKESEQGIIIHDADNIQIEIL